MITMKSVSIPVLLVAVIQGSIWINMGIPYFTDTSLLLIGYMIISALQLGATIDYAILSLTDTGSSESVWHLKMLPLRLLRPPVSLLQYLLLYLLSLVLPRGTFRDTVCTGYRSFARERGSLFGHHGHICTAGAAGAFRQSDLARPAVSLSYR
jgi:hypothetical protein